MGHITEILELHFPDVGDPFFDKGPSSLSTDRVGQWQQWRKDLGLGPHSGNDRACPEGTPLRAPIAGKATFSVEGSLGNHVIITNGRWRAILAHCSRFLSNRPRWVDLWELVAYSGNTGTSTAPHLHWMIEEDRSLGGNWADRDNIVRWDPDVLLAWTVLRWMWQSTNVRKSLYRVQI